MITKSDQITKPISEVLIDTYPLNYYANVQTDKTVVMAKEKFQVTFLVSLLFMILKNSSEHNCSKGAEEQRRKVAVSGNIFKVNQKYGESCLRS